MIKDVEEYFAAVKKDRNPVVDELFTQLSRRVKSEPLKGSVEKQGTDIKQAIGAGFDEALELSSRTTIRNYQNWYELLSSIDAKLPITYKTLSQAIKPTLAKPKKLVRRKKMLTPQGK